MTKRVTIDLDAITNELDDLKDAEAQLKFQLKNIQDRIDAKELQLQALLDQLGINEMQHGIYKWYYKESSRTALDQKLIKERYPEQCAECTLTKVSKGFKFEINK